MEKKGSRDTSGGDFRRRAEERLKARDSIAALYEGKDPTALVHELQVQQIEIEMQNEELIRSRLDVEESRRSFQELYEFAPVGYLALDPAKRIVSANLVGALMLGLERDLLIGRPLDAFIDSGSLRSFNAFFDALSTGEYPGPCQLRLSCSGSAGAWVKIGGASIASGEIGKDCRLISLTDISEHVQAKEVIKILNEQAVKAENLAAANRLDAFNYMVSHDLLNHLNVIGIHCQVLREVCRDKIAPDCIGYVDEAYSSVLRMEGFINSMLKFARLSHGKLSRRSFNISNLAMEIGLGLKTMNPAHRTDLRIEEGIMANGDRDLLRVVLENLLGNAFKFTEKKKEAVIGFGIEDRGGKRIYFVRDNGEGFDMADADRIFIPFHRLPGSEEFKGSGIGLATVARIVRRHSGRIWAESEQGNGAIFFFTLGQDDGSIRIKS